MNFYIKTYGCQMNTRDSDAATAMLCKSGHTPVKKEEQADVIILNTCTVRGKAEDKAIGKLGFLKRLKRKNENLLLGMMGCAAQRMGEDIFDQVPHLDFVVGTDQLHKIADIVNSEIKDRHRFVDISPERDVLTSMGDHHKVDNKKSEFIAIMRGCDRYCTFCIVPKVRGAEKSREIEDIVAEAQKLADAGVVELTLLGQNVSAYGLPGVRPPIPNDVSPFARLLEAISDIEGIKRIRFTSPHPSYFNDELIEAFGRLPKVCSSLHFPLQSGSDSILKKMNRPYTSAEFIEVARKLKVAKPDLTFSTDVIVGFPGETDDDFEETRRVFKEVEFDNAYIFKYSPRSGTAAARWPDQISDKIKEKRNQILLADLGEITIRHHEEMINSVVEIMVGGVSKRNTETWRGLTQTNQVVIFYPEDGVEIGDLIKLKVNRVTRTTLYGEIV